MNGASCGCVTWSHGCGDPFQLAGNSSKLCRHGDERSPAGEETVLSTQGGRLDRAMRSGVMRTGGTRHRVVALAWVAVLLAILTFLVIYPLLTLLLGALTDTNPVIEGFGLRHLSLANFITVLGNPNVAEALF